MQISQTNYEIVTQHLREYILSASKNNYRIYLLDNYHYYYYYYLLQVIYKAKQTVTPDQQVKKYK